MHQHAARSQTLRRNGFTFKQFFVAHDRCAMKVGTDAILLGAWASVPQTGRVLDIGCGSGIITLMLAQRSPDAVTFDAVEVEPEASAQAQENRQASPWASRITVVNRDIETFTAQTAFRYALIVSNPPYFLRAVPVGPRRAARPAIRRVCLMTLCSTVPPGCWNRKGISV